MKKTCTLNIDETKMEMWDNGVLVAEGYDEIRQAIRLWNYEIVEEQVPPPATEYTLEDVLDYFAGQGYREAMKLFHPDHGGLTWQAQAINAAAGK